MLSPISEFIAAYKDGSESLKTLWDLLNKGDKNEVICFLRKQNSLPNRQEISAVFQKFYQEQHEVLQKKEGFEQVAAKIKRYQDSKGFEHLIGIPTDIALPFDGSKRLSILFKQLMTISSFLNNEQPQCTVLKSEDIPAVLHLTQEDLTSLDLGEKIVLLRENPDTQYQGVQELSKLLQEKFNEKTLDKIKLFLAISSKEILKAFIVDFSSLSQNYLLDRPFRYKSSEMLNLCLLGYKKAGLIHNGQMLNKLSGYSNDEERSEMAWSLLATCHKEGLPNILNQHFDIDYFCTLGDSELLKELVAYHLPGEAPLDANLFSSMLHSSVLSTKTEIEQVEFLLDLSHKKKLQIKFKFDIVEQLVTHPRLSIMHLLQKVLQTFSHDSITNPKFVPFHVYRDYNAQAAPLLETLVPFRKFKIENNQSQNQLELFYEYYCFINKNINFTLNRRLVREQFIAFFAQDLVAVYQRLNNTVITEQEIGQFMKEPISYAALDNVITRKKSADRLFVYALFYQDGFFTLKNKELTKQEQLNVRFFTFFTRLPMELQMILCLRSYQQSQNNITAEDVEIVYNNEGFSFLNA